MSQQEPAKSSTETEKEKEQSEAAQKQEEKVAEESAAKASPPTADSTAKASPPDVGAVSNSAVKASPPNAAAMSEEKKGSDFSKSAENQSLYKIQVGNLQPGVTEKNLERIFKRNYGSITDIQVQAKTGEEELPTAVISFKRRREAHHALSFNGQSGLCVQLIEQPFDTEEEKKLDEPDFKEAMLRQAQAFLKTDDYKIIVANLEPDVTSERLLAAFRNFYQSAFEAVQIEYDEASDTKTFVMRFQDAEEANKALCLKALGWDDKMLLNSELIVEPFTHERKIPTPEQGVFATGDNKIYVGNLAPEISRQDLISMFRRFPSLQQASIVPHQKTNKSCGYGFVFFEKELDAHTAVKEMNGILILGKPLQVNMYRKRVKKWYAKWKQSDKDDKVNVKVTVTTNNKSSPSP